jgi:PAS domain S-box-containing protein
MSARSAATIVFVDDNPVACFGLVTALRTEGFTVTQAATGADALRLVRDRPDLVILDVQLPDLDGFEVGRRIKADPDLSSVLIMYLSGQFISSEDKVQGLEEGADAYLVKPVSPHELIAHVKALLRLRRAETALQESEARLQDILDHAPVLVHVKDLQGGYLLVNRCWEECFHRSRAEVVGKNIREVFPPEVADVLLANDMQVIRAGSPLQFEEITPQDDGPHTYLSVKFPLRGPDGAARAVCGVSTDITERKQAEKALRDSEALYHSLVETLPVAIFRKDCRGHFSFANQAFCARLGVPAPTVLGKTDRDFYPTELADKYVHDDQRVMDTGEVFEDVEQHQDPEGAPTYVEVIKSTVRDSQGVTVGMQGIYWDVTARKRAEEALGRTAAEFRVARRIQQKLFPTSTPRLPGLDIGSATFAFDIGGASYPAEAIGGDYYDYLSLPDGSLGVAIGDVSGHGIGPALLMAEVRAYLRAFAQTQASPGDILAAVNRIICQDIEGDRFITLLLAHLDPCARSFCYASAGHPSGYVLGADGGVKRALDSTSIPVGIVPECDFPTSDVMGLDPGDIVVLLTDGVVEARAPDGAVFGTRRALELVRVFRRSPAREIVENLYYAVRAFAQNQPQYDDITATVIKVAPAPKEGPQPLGHGAVKSEVTR